MKMSAPNTLKFKKLKMRLQLNHWQTVGLLESIWLFTQLNSPAGDIGKFSNDDIAVGIEWAGDPEKLVMTLVETGWLDSCEKNRLLVHDWADHAPTYLKGAMSKNNISFAVLKKTQVKARKDACVDSAKQGAKQGAKTEVDLHLSRVPTPPQQAAPNLSKPNLSKPNLTEPSLSESSSLPPAVAVVDQKRKKKPNPLFDAVAEVTGMDPSINGSLLGKVAASLAKADPPYTPEDVREFGRDYGIHCPWGPSGGRDRPTPGELEKYISYIRAAPAPATATQVNNFIPKTAADREAKNFNSTFSNIINNATPEEWEAVRKRKEEKARQDHNRELLRKGIIPPQLSTEPIKPLALSSHNGAQ